MKRGTHDHPKLKALARTLGVPRPHAIGVLELLWYFTATYAPRGDVGRYSDADIAEACEWPPDRDPSELVRALVSCRWLDEHPTYRLVVHDWPEHADPYVHATLAKRGETFYDGTIPRIDPHLFNSATRKRLIAQYDCQVQDQSRTSPGPVLDQSMYTKTNTNTKTNAKTESVYMAVPRTGPGLVQDEPRTSPGPTKGQTHTHSPDLSSYAKQIWERHPAHRRPSLEAVERSLAAAVADAVDPEAVARRIVEVHRGWCESEEWQRASGRFCPKLDRWLEQGGWQFEPPDDDF